MKRRYIGWMVAGLAIAALASVGLYWTLRSLPDEGMTRDDGQRMRSPEENPTIKAPGTGMEQPEPQVDHSRPDGGTP